MMAANIAPLFQHGKSLARLAVPGAPLVSPDRKPYLWQNGAPSTVLFFTKEEKRKLAVGGGWGWAGPKNQL